MKPLKTVRLGAALLVGAALTLLTGLPVLLGAAAVYGASFLTSIPTNLPPGVLMDISITTSTILEDWQEYYVNAGQSAEDILQAVQDKRDFINVAERRVVDGDIYQLSESEITDVLQAFKNTFSAKGAVTMTPVPIRLRNVKIDLSLNPDKIKSSYYGFLAGLPSADRASWPIVRWIWEKLVMPKSAANLAYVDWAGQFVSPTENSTAGTTLGAYDGLKKIITDDLDGGTPKMNELTLTNSLLNTAQTFSAFEETLDQLDQKYHDEEMVYLCSPKTYLAYFRDRRNSIGDNADYAMKNNSRVMTLDGRDNHEIIKMNGIGRAGDHGWLVVTPKRNLFHCNRQNAYNVAMESDKRSVALMADWYEGVGFGLAEEVFVVRQTDESSN
jgi:hypothetical protein